MIHIEQHAYDNTIHEKIQQLETIWNDTEGGVHSMHECVDFFPGLMKYPDLIHNMSPSVRTGMCIEIEHILDRLTSFTEQLDSIFAYPKPAVFVPTSVGRHNAGQLLTLYAKANHLAEQASLLLNQMKRLEEGEATDDEEDMA